MEESFAEGLLEYPQFTRPAEYRGMRVPDVLLSGHHGEVERWRRAEALERTRRSRPDLLAATPVDDARAADARSRHRPPCYTPPPTHPDRLAERANAPRDAPIREPSRDQRVTAVTVLDDIVADQIRTDLPELAPGDTVRVSAKVVEGNRERIQVFEGTVMRLRGGGITRSITVRALRSGVGVERTFKVNSPRIEKIEVVRHGDGAPRPAVLPAQACRQGRLPAGAPGLASTGMGAPPAGRGRWRGRRYDPGVRSGGPHLRAERALWQQGKRLVVGVDEVGMGALCAPVVAAAVLIRPNTRKIAGVRDSKTLSARQREAVVGEVKRRCLAWGVGAASVAEIERLNIYHASHLAMRRALRRVDGLRPRPGGRAQDRGLRGPGRSLHLDRGRGCLVLRHRLRLHRGQGHPRPADGPPRPPLPGVRLGAERGLRHPGSRRGPASHGPHRPPPAHLSARPGHP